MQQSPGLSIIRFYDRNGHIFLPSNVLCVNLAQSLEVKPWKHQGSQTSFLLLDSCWHAFCQDQKVLAYVHSSGSICLPTEVVCHLNVSQILWFLIKNWQIPYPQVPNIEELFPWANHSYWAHGLGV